MGDKDGQEAPCHRSTKETTIRDVSFSGTLTVSSDHEKSISPQVPLTTSYPEGGLRAWSVVVGVSTYICTASQESVNPTKGCFCVFRYVSTLPYGALPGNSFVDSSLGWINSFGVGPLSTSGTSTCSSPSRYFNHITSTVLL